MWIRSQDKEILIKATCICLGSENHICAYASNAEGDNWYIGKYSTKEKALKVLDEIQKLIINSLVIAYLNHNYQIEGVFQMPQDDEVEE
jgi:hypothetical protein